jgi:hypothetical protein
MQIRTFQEHLSQKRGSADGRSREIWTFLIIAAGKARISWPGAEASLTRSHHRLIIF